MINIIQQNEEMELNISQKRAKVQECLEGLDIDIDLIIEKYNNILYCNIKNN